MRFGYCAGPAAIPAVEAVGYDYIELPTVAVLPESPEDDFKPVRKELLAHNIRPEAWNILLPRHIKVTGPDADIYRVQRYLRTAFARIASVGGEVIVFGSGGARSVPEGFPVETARKQILEFLIHCQEVAAEHDIMVAIEPLSKKESNIINTVEEALEFADALNAPNVRVLADLYHMNEEGEPFSSIETVGLHLAHVHTADTGREHPGTGSYDHAAFFKALKVLDYDGRISVECKCDEFASQASLSLAFLRDTWTAAG